MSNTLQEFLASMNERAATELAEAFLTLPEGKRGWSPAKTARTAMNLMAECALNNGYTADLIANRKWSVPEFGEYIGIVKGAEASGWESLESLLKANTARLAETIRAQSDAELAIEVDTPYGRSPLSGLATYPYWNMSYHTGQIFYIGSILEGEE